MESQVLDSVSTHLLGCLIIGYISEVAEFLLTVLYFNDPCCLGTFGTSILVPHPLPCLLQSPPRSVHLSMLLWPPLPLLPSVLQLQPRLPQHQSLSQLRVPLLPQRQTLHAFASQHRLRIRRLVEPVTTMAQTNLTVEFNLLRRSFLFFVVL
jgi:hypothetical protein